ncbi:MAG: tetratricopeptide repeat protein [Candidatus Obscuribacterales bacterium]|nr:tetratricopeptide repeat protein [Candidatus Obscuribacterales bacterium]
MSQVRSSDHRRYFMVALSVGLCVMLSGVPALSAPMNVFVPPRQPAQSLVLPGVSPAERSPVSLPANARLLYSSLTGTAKLIHRPQQFMFAEAMLIEDLQQVTRIGGAVSMPAATAMNNLGFLCQDIGAFSRAESYFLRALKIVEHCKGDNEVAGAIIQQNLADMYAAEHHWLPALSHYRKAVATLERRLGEQHDVTRAVRKKYDALRVRFISLPGVVVR